MKRESDLSRWASRSKELGSANPLIAAFDLLRWKELVWFEPKNSRIYGKQFKALNNSVIEQVKTKFLSTGLLCTFLSLEAHRSCQ